MNKIALLIWTVAAPTLMGCFVLVVLLMPSLADKQMEWIPYSALAGAVLAAPLSYVIAKMIQRAMR